jgi:hypothetical protein
MDRNLVNEICKWGLARLVRDIPDPSFSSAEFQYRTTEDGQASFTDLLSQKKSEEKLTAGRELP